MDHSCFVLLGCICLFGLVIGCQDETESTQTASNSSSQFIDEVPGIPFGWPFRDVKEFQPRGGTTRGTPVTRKDGPSERWKALQENDLSKLERDRRAILALAGSYRVSFQFLETMGFTDEYEPKRPYFSWATEYIDVLEDENTFIRLQHILVMYFKKEGEVKGPMVMKHWRQDWRYEDQEILKFQGNRTWEKKQLSSDAVDGHWTQTVYQVDDAPRYEAIGRWEHGNHFSSWTSQTFRRPLPRREFSVRDDYDLLEGTNTITITPTGWVHEQNNRKVKLPTPNGNQLQAKPNYIAKEYGINRYERITEPDVSGPASSYWKRTGAFWEAVRSGWQKQTEHRERFQLAKKVDGKKLHKHLFQHASEIENRSSYDPEKGNELVRNLLEQYVRTPKN